MTAAAVPARARPRVPALAPNRDETVDGLMLLALSAIGLVGFRATYGGDAYLVAGVGGAVLGVALSHVGHRVRLPLLAVLAVGLLALLLLGGLASRPGVAGGVPSVPTMRGVVGAAIGGWKEL